MTAAPAVSLTPFTGDFMNERATAVCNDVCTSLIDDSVANSVCCPIAQLSTLTYVDVQVRCNANGPSVTTRALADTGAQISVIKSELLDGFETEIRGKIKLQPFFGDAIEADWVKLQISPFIEDEEFNDAYITVDCAIVSHSNENMILTSDVLARLEMCERNINVVSCNTVDSPSCISDTEVKTLQPSSDDAVPNVDDHTIVIDDMLSDGVGDDNESDMGIITHGEIFTDDTASAQQVAEEQRSDDTLKGCFKLARAGKGGFELHDNLLYHRKNGCW